MGIFDKIGNFLDKDEDGLIGEDELIINNTNNQ